MSVPGWTASVFQPKCAAMPSARGTDRMNWSVNVRDRAVALTEPIAEVWWQRLVQLVFKGSTLQAQRQPK